jgi:hypothetical protein
VTCELFKFLGLLLLSLIIHELTHYMLAIYYSREPKLVVTYTKIYIYYRSKKTKKGFLETAIISITPTFLNFIIGLILLNQPRYGIIAYFNFLNLLNLTPFTKDGFYFYKSIIGYFSAKK